VSRVLLGVDTGGTFTDFVCYADGRLQVHKVLSTPSAPEQAILQGIRELGLAGSSFYLVHGSTVATNAVLEGKGVRTAYVTNRGFGDLLTIGRQARRELYNLQPPSEKPPVPPALCLEVGGRLGPDAERLDALDDDEIRGLVARVEELGAEAVAINFLFSYLDDSAERRIERALPDSVFVSRSSYILPEQGEYERGVATWLNAWVGPRVQGYLNRLKCAIEPAPLHVMQSSALTIDADQAARRAVNLLLSGPAGGLMGALATARDQGIARLLTFDMGGTSTDVSLLDGKVNLTSEGRIGRYPVAVPMVDMHTIGAGGGSLARVDEGGMLAVGPESAGADPGPACYARGGRQPTVTDANLVLGRLRPDAFLGGGMRLDAAAAQAALDRLGKQMDLNGEQAALGVVKLANEHMAQALRVISVQRGIDPRDYTLVAFGGAGGLHVCALAETLGIRRALVPMHAGVLSALGMLAAPKGRQLSHTLCVPLLEQTDTGLRTRFAGLAARGRNELLAEGVSAQRIEAAFSLDLRYQGQRFALNIPYRDLRQAADDFHRAHRQRFGHALDVALELVNLRVGLSAGGEALSLEQPPAAGAAGEPLEVVNMTGERRPVPVWRREDLDVDRHHDGPLLVIDIVATTYVAGGWRVRRLAHGGLSIER
jgi:N-methylhydantoinase A